MIIFERRNSPSPKNPLKKFEIFESILMSLTESTYISIEAKDGKVVLRNRKYFMSFLPDDNMTEIVLRAVVLRQIRLSILDVLALYGMMREGTLRVGRLEEESSENEDLCRCVLEIVS